MNNIQNDMFTRSLVSKIPPAAATIYIVTLGITPLALGLVSILIGNDTEISVFGFEIKSKKQIITK